MTEQPTHIIEAVEGSTTQNLLRLEIITLDMNIFDQIEEPFIPSSYQSHKIAEIAEREAIAIVIVPVERRGTQYQRVYLFGQGEHRLWRWPLGPARAFPEQSDDYPWLLTLPQIFLAKSRRKKGV